MLLNVKLLKEDAIVPAYAHDGDSGLDLHAYLEVPLVLKPGERALVKTGIAVDIPQGQEGQIRGRSGQGLKRGLGIVNGVGTIDSGYVGELGVLLINHGQESVEILHKERIAQFVVAPVSRVVVQVVQELKKTARADGGFGSTGA